MKLKILIILIIVSSIISWFIGTFLMLKYFPNIINFKVKNIETFEIQKENKNITIKNLENEITNIVQEVSPWVVSIIAKKDLIIYRNDPWWFFHTPVWTVNKETWWWTWFFITKEWIIITNEHVISDNDAEYTIITNNKKEYIAEILAKNKIQDLAILKIKNTNNESFKVIDLIKSNQDIKIWQFAIAIWNALNEFKNSVSFWVISWKNREISVWNYFWKEQILKWLLQTDTAINPWNSWWPLINLNWEVIWINTAIAWNSQWIWFSIELNKEYIDNILKDLQ